MIKLFFRNIIGKLVIFFGRWNTVVPETSDDIKILRANLRVNIGYYIHKAYWIYSQEVTVKTKRDANMIAAMVDDVIGWKSVN